MLKATLIAALMILSASAQARSAQKFWSDGTYNCEGQIFQMSWKRVYANGREASNLRIDCAADGSGCSFWVNSFKRGYCTRIAN